jgi:hypothetical protein
MDSHYHLLFETPEPNLVARMRRLNQVFTQGFNRRQGRVGHVLQGRYKSIVVEKQSYLLELIRYVVLNPVRAGMVATPEEWPWSSYRATAGLAAAPPWLQVTWVLANFGAEREAARAAYRRFVALGGDAASPWRSLRGQIWLGGERFRERMARMAAQQDLTAVPATLLSLTLIHESPAGPRRVPPPVSYSRGGAVWCAKGDERPTVLTGEHGCGGCGTIAVPSDRRRPATVGAVRAHGRCNFASHVSTPARSMFANGVGWRQVCRAVRCIRAAAAALPATAPMRASPRPAP